MKGLSADVPHLLANSQLADDAYMRIERQFLTEVEYAEELASTVGQIAGMLKCRVPAIVNHYHLLVNPIGS